jgi:hypothetical protein
MSSPAFGPTAHKFPASIKIKRFPLDLKDITASLAQ